MFHDSSSYLIRQIQRRKNSCLSYSLPPEAGSIVSACLDIPGGYGQRKAMPETWRGIAGKELRRVSGVPDAVFYHPVGFIGWTETLKGAVEMAKRAVE